MPEITMQDREVLFMKRCLELASLAGNATGTNPKVGAVIVHEDKIIGEGYHRKFGGPHAEIEALANVSPSERPLIAGSTMYVSLEPCSHHGKTPPCAGRIVSEKISRVVTGCFDPNPVVSGKGIEYLRNHGIEVTTSILEHEAKSMIRPFRAHLEGLPYIILKWATSSDGFISQKGKQTWLTNDMSRTLVHKWRAEADAVMVGKNTLITDKPRLTVRETAGNNPVRIVADTHLESLDFLRQHYSDESWTVLNRVRSGREGTINLVHYEDESGFRSAFSKLFLSGIHTIIIEGGSELLTSIINTGLWHEARIFTVRCLLNEGIRAPHLEGRLRSKLRLGDDVLHTIDNIQLHYD